MTQKSHYWAYTLRKGGWYGEVGREEGSGWGACDFFLNKIFEKKIKKKKDM